MTAVETLSNFDTVEQSLTNLNLLEEGELPPSPHLFDKTSRVEDWISKQVLQHKPLIGNPPRDRNYKCTQCRMTFVNPESLESHTRLHSGDKPFKCDICNQTFSLQMILNTHKCIHNQTKLCPVCQQTFSEADFAKHSHADFIEKMYKCGFCNALFIAAGELHGHMDVHKLESTQKRIIQELEDGPRKRFCREYYGNSGLCTIKRKSPTKSPSQSCENTITPKQDTPKSQVPKKLIYNTPIKRYDQQRSKSKEVNRIKSTDRIQKLGRRSERLRSKSVDQHYEIYNCCGTSVKSEMKPTKLKKTAVSTEISRSKRSKSTDGTNVTYQIEVKRSERLRSKSRERISERLRSKSADKRCELYGCCKSPVKSETKSIKRKVAERWVFEEVSSDEEKCKRKVSKPKQATPRKYGRPTRARELNLPETPPESCEDNTSSFDSGVTVDYDSTSEISSPSQPRLPRLFRRTGRTSYKCMRCRLENITVTKAHVCNPETKASDSEPKKVKFDCTICAVSFSYEQQLELHSRTAHEQCPLCNVTFKTVGELNEHTRTHAKQYEAGVRRRSSSSCCEISADNCPTVIDLVGSDDEADITTPVEKRESILVPNLFCDLPTTLSRAQRHHSESKDLIKPYQIKCQKIRQYVNPRRSSIPKPCLITETIEPAPNIDLEVPSDTNLIQPKTLLTPLIDQLSEITFRPTRGSYCDCRTCNRKPSKSEYKCDQCPLAYRKEGSLKLHKRRHTGEAPFECQLCTETFPTESELQVHTFNHLGVFTCDYCNQKFPNLNTLDEHVKNVHLVDSMEWCYHCNGYVRDIKSHVELRHSEEIERGISRLSSENGMLMGKMEAVKQEPLGDDMEVILILPVKVEPEEDVVSVQSENGLFTDLSRIETKDASTQCCFLPRKRRRLKKPISPKKTIYKCPNCPQKYLSHLSLTLHHQSSCNSRLLKSPPTKEHLKGSNDPINRTPPVISTSCQLLPKYNCLSCGKAFQFKMLWQSHQAKCLNTVIVIG